MHVILRAFDGIASYFLLFARVNGRETNKISILLYH
nr:MAG TPA: hypothetical protein [Caudoviricetes sp.]